MTTPATFTIGPHDTIEDVNDAACELLGYSRAELIGLHGSDLIPSEQQARTAVSLDRMRLGALVLRDGVLRRKNGTCVPVAVEARVLADNRLALDVRPRVDP